MPDPRVHDVSRIGVFPDFPRHEEVVRSGMHMTIEKMRF